ncbi:MAG TPA: hypothetical protein VMM56_10995 [Planctomycetaceae bacterium]|nr:hypothetical protein [Planctomycetaceae bacterium]
MPEIPATLPPENKRSRLATLLRPKVAIPVFLLVLLLISPMIIRGWRLRDVPNVPEPFDPKPLLSLEIPDDENAYTHYREAMELFHSPTDHVLNLIHGDFETPDPRGILREGWHLADDEVRQFLIDNQLALKEWKKGTQQQQALPFPVNENDFSVDLDVDFTLSTLTLSASLLARKLEAEDNLSEAWEWYRAAIRSSRHCGTNGSLIERGLGASIFSEVSEQLDDWATNPRVSDELLKHAIRNLQTDWKLTAKSSTVFQVEYLMQMNSIEKAHSGVDGKSWEDYYVRNVPSNPFEMYLAGEPEFSFRLIRLEFYNRLLSCDLLPFERDPSLEDRYLIPTSVTAATAKPLSISSAEFERLLYDSLIAKQTLPGLTQFQTKIDIEEIRFRTLLTAIAGQAFYRDHGHFPEILDELVPDYLDEAPIDIYDGKPLKYVHQPEGPVVYSVFENLRDDGGTDLKSRKGKYYTTIEPDDLGFQMRIPGIKPLRADKPFIVEDDDSE